uniref:GAG-pre-integrase domain-containing protein n=1 Tax=Fagus sylvatica TaxID=28930 RepID=A0A2N9HID0_FAGSY
MSSGSNTEHPTGASQSDSMLTKFTTKLTEALSKVQTPTLSTEPPAAPIGIKLNDTNYALWSQVVEMYISGKDKLGYINEDLPQPPTTDPSFRKWRTDNAIVKGWLINSMDSSLIGNFIRFPTAKMVWDSIATTYFDGSDTSQVYDLRRRVMQLKQAGGSLEQYYNDLQGLWREIDFRRPNPMECAVDIHKYNTILQEDRVYVFLDGLDDRLDKIRGDVLQLRPFPTVEQAYAHVRREAIRQTVMITGNAEAVSGAKHTRDTCFKLHGYPDWWSDLQAKKRRDTSSKDEAHGTAAVAHAAPQLSLTPPVAHGSDVSSSSDPGNLGCVCFSSPSDTERDTWLLDSGATDHMTFDAKDFTQTSLPKRTNIANANGVISPVTGAGTVILTPTLQLPNTLLVPSLSHKLLSDILTKEIIGRGTKRGGLYYMDDFSVGRAHHMQHSVGVKEREIWLWHRRLGHPSFVYMKHLFPDLFSHLQHIDTPIVQNHKLGIYPDQKPADKGRYQREEHMEAVTRILKYLKSSPGKGLMFSKNDHLEVEGYTDADWAGNISDRKSTSGYFTFVGGNLVTWRSKKQKVVALSSAEAEFRGMAKGLCELLWLKRLLTEIGFAPTSEMNLFCDNKAAIDISHNPIQHDRTKHVEVDRHFIKHNLETKIVQFPFVKSEDQLADILTKAVSSKEFYNSLVKLCIRDPYAST